MDAVDEAAGKQGGVEARAGFGEEREDAFCAELVEDLARGTRPWFSGENFDANAARAEFVDAGSRR